MDLSKTVLVLIDIQNDYLPGGKCELWESKKASLKAKKLLEEFRRKGLPVIHVRHENLKPEAAFFTPNSTGAEIYQEVASLASEPVILKHQRSSFIGTDFETELRSKEIEQLIICGMQTNCCVLATTLDALQNGFRVTVIEDAVAAKNIEVHQEALKEMKEKQAQIMKNDELIISQNN